MKNIDWGEVKWNDIDTGVVCVFTRDGNGTDEPRTQTKLDYPG